ncbi:MAG: hypothetical protein ACKOQP_00535 [Bacteroidota bacterium]
MAQRDGLPVYIANIAGGCSKIRFATRDGFGDSRLTENLRTGAYIDVFLDAHLTPQAHAVRYTGFATDPDLSGN